MEILLLGIYSFFVWLIFFKFRWLPWNFVSQVIVITIPAVTGVVYSIDGVEVAAGAQPAITEDVVVTAAPLPGYVFPAVIDDDWLMEHTP